jgi:Delta7-sterol 5-desaturase
MTALLAWAIEQPWSLVVLYSALINVAVFGAALGFGAVLTQMGKARGASVVPTTDTERLLAGACVVGNSIVMAVGWWLFQGGALVIRADVGFGHALLDALILATVMDLAMFFTHRAAHLPIVYRYVHGLHHRCVHVTPLSLFVLHPLEVLAFGGLWICVLLTLRCSLEGMLLYLTFNTVFGIVGHLGFEPLPQHWLGLPGLRNLGSSTFHGRHHEDPNVNFGFYTTIWDRLFRSLSTPRQPG